MCDCKEACMWTCGGAPTCRSAFMYTYTRLPKKIAQEAIEAAEKKEAKRAAKDPR